VNADEFSAFLECPFGGAFPKCAIPGSGDLVIHDSKHYCTVDYCNCVPSQGLHDRSQHELGECRALLEIEHIGLPELSNQRRSRRDVTSSGWPKTWPMYPGRYPVTLHSDGRGEDYRMWIEVEQVNAV
jgi:hypothetical protein